MIKFKRLPKEYQRVEYIESTGTQYIDTGIIANYNSRVILSAFSNTLTGNRALIGARKENSSVGYYDAFCIWQTTGEKTRWDYGNTSNNITGPTWEIGNINNIEKNGRYNYFNNTQIRENNVATFNSQYSFYLFNVNTNGFAKDVDRGFFGRLYSCKIYNENILQRNFIPCYRKSDNEIGLYDLVNNVFYTNQGTGTFIKGNDILTEIKQIKTKINNEIKDIEYIKTFRVTLPSEYQEVEYIESTGTQYIDTGINETTTKTEIEMNFKITSFNYYHCLFCSRENMFSNTRSLFITEMFGFRNDANTQKYVSKSLSYNQMYNLKSTKTNLILNNEVIDTYELTQTINNRKLVLLNSYDEYQTMSPTNGAKIKLYKCKIWEDDVLVRDFIPCYRKSDNEIGLYDLVNNVFYTNAGTGEFLKGNNISNKVFDRLPIEYQRVSYLESTGTQYIDIGIKLNNNDIINLEVMPIYASSSGSLLFGVRTSATENNLTINVYENRFQLDYGNYLINRKDIYLNNFLNNYHKIYISNTNFIVDNILVDLSQVTFETTNYTKLFFAGGNQYLTNKFVGRIKNLKIKGKIDFIPCYRKSDNKPGFYDILTKEFYTNAGTGEFLVGDDI